jgi:hypothetical protein
MKLAIQYYETRDPGSGASSRGWLSLATIDLVEIVLVAARLEKVDNLARQRGKLFSDRGQHDGGDE